MTNHEEHDSMMNHIFYALKQGSMNRPNKTATILIRYEITDQTK